MMLAKQLIIALINIIASPYEGGLAARTF
jgi:hypothetical protein